MNAMKMKTTKIARTVSCALLAGTVLFTPNLALAQTVAPATQPQRPVQAPARPKPVPVAQPAAPSSTALAKATEDVVARVGSTDIMADDIRAYIAMLGPREQAALAKEPALLSQTVRLLLANRLVLQEAVARKWDQQPAVAAQLQNARENTLVESYLRSVTALPDSFPSDAEVQSVYDANKTALMAPRSFQIAQIFIAIAKDADKAATDAARKKLADVQLKLKQPGANFAAIARTDSDEKETAERGGEIGWLTEAQLRPEIRTTVIGLGKNAVAEPIQMDDGWHLLKLVETKPAGVRPLDEVREQLVARLREERSGALRRAYIAKLAEQSPPVVNELALSKLLEPPAK